MAANINRILNARFSQVTFYRLNDTKMVITTSEERKEIKAYLYGALISREIAGKCIAIAIAEKNMGASASLYNIVWDSFHLKTYRTLDDIIPQVPIDWDRLYSAQQLTVGAYEELEDCNIKELSSLRTETTRTYAIDGYKHHRITLETLQAKGPKGMSSTDLPRESTLMPAIEHFNTVIELW